MTASTDHLRTAASDPARTSFFRRWGLWILLAMILPAPAVAWMAGQTMTSMSNDTTNWLPQTFAETQEYQWFIQRFGTDEILVLSWPGCTLADERLDAIIAAATKVRNPELPGNPPYFSRAISGRSVTAQLSGEPLNLSAAESATRLDGWLVGPDGQTTCAVFTPYYTTVRFRSAAIEVVRQAAIAAGVPAEELRFGGPTVDSVAVDTESQRSLLLLTVCSIVAGLTLSWWFLRSLWLVALVALTAGASEVTSLAAVWATGGSMDMLLAMMPALVYILVTSGCIHQLNYYLDEARTHGIPGAPERALKHSWRPSMLAAVTTALGLASLAIGDLAPARRFGIYSAIGVMIGFGFLVLLPTTLLEFFPPRRLIAEEQSRGHRRPLLARYSLRLAAMGWHHHRVLLALGLIVAPVLSWGALRVQTSVKLQHLFSSHAKVLNDYRWFEENLGPLVPIEMVVRFQEDDSRTELQRLALVESMRRRVEEIDDLGATMSLATFLPPLPTGSSTRDIIRSKVIDRRFANNRDELRATHFLMDDRDIQEQLWRIGVRVKAFTDQDYTAVLARMRELVEPLTRGNLGQGRKPVSVLLCGGVPLVTLVQRAMLNDLASSFTTAVLTIALTMAIVLRNPGASLVMMIPNVLPAALIFGLLGWTGTFVDLGSMMTISTALGMSVDNELHFFSWFRRALDAGHNRRRATLYAYRQCGAAMTESAVICAVGMAPFALSPFVPVSRFGWLMCLMIFAAMIADVIVMPALLASPLGAFFGRSGGPKPELQPAPIEEESFVFALPGELPAA